VVRVIILTLVALAALAAGCRHVEQVSLDEGDGGSDTDTATDTDFPTDTSAGYCETEPVTCDDVGGTAGAQYLGCCFDGALYWCWEQDQIWVDSIDCELNGGACEYDPLSQWMDCVYD
jgi:hypothetical protein